MDTMFHRNHKRHVLVKRQDTLNLKTNYSPNFGLQELGGSHAGYQAFHLDTPSMPTAGCFWTGSSMVEPDLSKRILVISFGQPGDTGVVINLGVYLNGVS